MVKFVSFLNLSRFILRQICLIFEPTWYHFKTVLYHFEPTWSHFETISYHFWTLVVSFLGNFVSFLKLQPPFLRWWLPFLRWVTSIFEVICLNYAKQQSCVIFVELNRNEFKRCIAPKPFSIIVSVLRTFISFFLTLATNISQLCCFM